MVGRGHGGVAFVGGGIIWVLIWVVFAGEGVETSARCCVSRDNSTMEEDGRSGSLGTSLSRLT
jgi:hypothetical protein